MVGSTVLKLYRKGLQQSGKDLSQVRKLIAMAAQLVSHLDNKDFEGSIYSGVKGDLAKKVKETLEGAKLGDKQLEIELNLVRPSWLGVLVARAMLQTRRLGAEDKTLVQLPERLDDLLWVLGNDRRGQLVLQCWAHRLLGLQKAYVILRRYWAEVTSPGQQFVHFQNLKTLKEKKSSQDYLKVEDVTVKLTEVKRSTDLLRKYASGETSWQEEGQEDEAGALPALFFRMKLVDTF